MVLFGRKVPPPVTYAMGTFFDKFFSIVTIPLMASAMTPAIYGQYDVVLALCAALTAVMRLGLSDTLVRFSTVNPDPHEQKRCTAELLGAGFVLVALGGVITQYYAPWFITYFNLSISLTAMRWTLAVTVVSGLMEFVLAWVRIRDRAGLYAGISVVRTLAAVAVTWTALLVGWGAEGVLIGNALAGLSICVGLVVYQIRHVGLGLSRTAFERVAVYGVPLIGAGLTAFAMSGLNRFFLPSVASYDEIGAFSLASRLSQAIWPFTAPFILWWYPKRIAVLLEPLGAQRSADMWGVGVSILILSCIGLALMGPLFINLMFPASYAHATVFLPAALALMALTQLPMMINAGVFARDTTLWALAIEAVSALVAVIGYFLLIPTWGINGSIAALGIAFCLRILLYVIAGNRFHPIPYNFGAAGVAIAVGITLVCLAPDPTRVLARFAWSVMTGGALIALILHLKLIKVPDAVLASLTGALRLGPR